MRNATVWLILAAVNVHGASLTAALIDQGYRQMYNLAFDEAHQSFAQCERERPEDPLAPVSDAAAYLFAEFDRLRILQSEFFTTDDTFLRPKRLAADPKTRLAFDAKLVQAEKLAGTMLARNPRNTDALFVMIMANGLRADYFGLVEKQYLESLRTVKNSRSAAEKLLSIDPSYYDAYLAIGVENYLLSLKPAPVRWLLRLGGAQTDRQLGIENVKITAEKGHLLRPYARLLLAVDALRSKNRRLAREILSDLARQFPRNRLYSEELARLD